ncbi:MAG: hypothetical protein K2J97_04420 [Muribaculaceae bacterium]|nr:hypothetical protein [Muribaculaceae bacterium]
MKITRLLVSAVLPMLCLTVAAQTADDNAPAKGNFTVAATVGYNSYSSVTAQPGTLTDYSVSAMSTNWSDKKLMVGFEAGYFVSDLWKLNLGGGLNFTHNPGYADVPGTIDANTPVDADGTMGEIPNYRAVASQYSCVYNVFAGVDRYFGTGVKNLMWYTGARLGVAYALNEQKADEWTSMGKSVGEAWNFRANFIVGVDYFVLPAMYVGASIDPFAYTYGMTTYRPQEGLANLSADSSNFSLLAAPTLKVGFKF